MLLQPAKHDADVTLTSRAKYANITPRKCPCNGDWIPCCALIHPSENARSQLKMKTVADPFSPFLNTSSRESCIHARETLSTPHMSAQYLFAGEAKVTPDANVGRREKSATCRFPRSVVPHGSIRMELIHRNHDMPGGPMETKRRFIVACGLLGKATLLESWRWNLSTGSAGN